MHGMYWTDGLATLAFASCDSLHPPKPNSEHSNPVCLHLYVYESGILDHLLQCFAAERAWISRVSMPNIPSNSFQEMVQFDKQVVCTPVSYDKMASRPHNSIDFLQRCSLVAEEMECACRTYDIYSFILERNRFCRCFMKCRLLMARQVLKLPPGLSKHFWTWLHPLQRTHGCYLVFRGNKPLEKFTGPTPYVDTLGVFFSAFLFMNCRAHTLEWQR
mmetsp:Transcript_48766/g.140247  ORF Transcript_48766/g.140247 Transcript_48766/m.140247 type:complete len:217 (+) Transcript_48766:1826-2476(+)